MQNAIDTWDGLSRKYNKIMIETERTTQVLEDPNWPGRDAVSALYIVFTPTNAFHRRKPDTDNRGQKKKKEESKKN